MNLLDQLFNLQLENQTTAEESVTNLNGRVHYNTTLHKVRAVINNVITSLATEPFVDTEFTTASKTMGNKTIRQSGGNTVSANEIGDVPITGTPVAGQSLRYESGTAVAWTTDKYGVASEQSGATLTKLGNGFGRQVLRLNPLADLTLATTQLGTLDANHDGFEFILFNQSSNKVTVNNNDAASGVLLGDPFHIISPNKSLKLVYVHAIGRLVRG